MLGMVREPPEERSWEERKTGGAGATTQSLCNRDYRRQIRKLEALNAADSEE